MSLDKVRRIHARPRRSMTFKSLVSAIALTMGATAAQALPVIPGGAGYGISTAAGRGGTVYKVTNLNADGAGSLKYCVDQKVPRVCVFEVSGTIRLTKDLKIANSKITIAGQTAPSPGIMIRGAGLQVQASDVLVQHLRVRPGDDPNGPDPDNRDALKIEGSTSKPVSNIVIDHCSFSWAIDEVASVWGPHDNITFSNNIFSEPLNESLHMSDDGRTREKHGFGVILGTSASGGRITMVGNIFAHQVERSPLARSRELVFVNNLVYDRKSRDFDGQTEYSRVTKSSIVGNVFLRGPSNDATVRPIYLRTSGSASLVSGARAYVADTYAPEAGDSINEIVSQTGGTLSGLLSTSTAPVWNSGLTARKTANNAVYNRVLQYAGARPYDRDSVDKRIVSHVKARSGGIVNCVSSNGTTRCNKNAGGWPSITQHTRRLTIPSNPGSKASNGYTNLENWLHDMDQAVQGITSAESPTSVPSLSVN
jgi:pectate lyase